MTHDSALFIGARASTDGDNDANATWKTKTQGQGRNRNGRRPWNWPRRGDAARGRGRQGRSQRSRHGYARQGYRPEHRGTGGGPKSAPPAARRWRITIASPQWKAA